MQKQEPGKPKTLAFEQILSFEKEEAVPLGYDAQVAQAVDLGQSWLLDTFQDNFMPKDIRSLGRMNRLDQPLGEAGLALFALFKAGLDPESDQAQEMLSAYFQKLKEFGYGARIKNLQLKRKYGAYVAAITLMVMESMLNPPETTKGKKKDSAYKKKKRNKFRGSSSLQKKSIKMAKACLDILLQGQGHVWNYDGMRYNGPPGGYSRAQYAVLGLRSAELLGLRVGKKNWKAIFEGVMEDYIALSTTHPFKATFEPGLLTDHPKQTGTGGWPYMKRNIPQNSKVKMRTPQLRFNMVCSGAGNLAMAMSFIKPSRRDKEKAQTLAVNALSFLQSQLPTYVNRVDYYGYYSFERVAVFYNLETLGEIHWHKELSKKLIADQMGNGGFGANRGSSMSYGTVISGAYAVLFLKKATKKLSYSVK